MFPFLFPPVIPGYTAFLPTGPMPREDNAPLSAPYSLDSSRKRLWEPEEADSAEQALPPIHKRYQPDVLKRRDPQLLEGSSVTAASSHGQPPPKEDLYTQLFDPDLKAIRIRQRDMGNCYFLAALDAILNHPDGDRLLRMIHIEPQGVATRKHAALCYQVTFPGRPDQPVKVPASDIGKKRCKHRPVQSTMGIQILEQAYGKLVRKERNQQRKTPFTNGGRCQTPILVKGGDASQALQDILGGNTVWLNTGMFNPFSKTNMEPTDPLAKDPWNMQRLDGFLASINQDTDYTYVLTADTPDDLPQTEPDHDIILLKQDTEPDSSKIRLGRDHAYSVRAFNLAQRTITVADPHDTHHKVHTMSLDEFCQAFSAIQGICILTAGEYTPHLG